MCDIWEKGGGGGESKRERKQMTCSYSLGSPNGSLCSTRRSGLLWGLSGPELWAAPLSAAQLWRAPLWSRSGLALVRGMTRGTLAVNAAAAHARRRGRVSDTQHSSFICKISARVGLKLMREVGGVMGERFRSVATTGHAAPGLVWQVARDGTRDRSVDWNLEKQCMCRVPTM